MNGFININKTKNMTSHDVVNIVRKTLNTKKVGHAGTLDPFATGVLPIAIGKATRFLEYITEADKSYRAEMLFGTETDTGDITGNIINQSNDFKIPKKQEVDEVINSFVGLIKQVPPRYSAIKINGRKAYELARKNIDFTLSTREVFINNISVIDLTDQTLTFDVDCSKGTYIRSLAVDIGKKLNLLATLKNLCRTRAGEFNISNAVTLERLKISKEAAIIPIDKCLNHLPTFYLSPNRLRPFCNGLSTKTYKNFDDDSIFRVYVDKEFVGIGKIFDGEIKAVKLAINSN